MKTRLRVRFALIVVLVATVWLLLGNRLLLAEPDVVGISALSEDDKTAQEPAAGIEIIVPADSPPEEQPKAPPLPGEVRFIEETAEPPEAAEEPLAGETLAEPPKKPEKIRFNFRYQPWKDVLEWFADQADLSFVLDAAPEGTLNYTDTREYTPAEAIDLLNSVLLTKGYTLIQRERMLMLINLEDGIPPNLVPVVPVEEIDKKGEYELISVLFELEKTKPEEVEAEIEKLIGPQGAVVPLARSRQIQVTETAGRLRAIRSVIRRIEDPQGDETGSMQAIELKFALTEDVLAAMRQMLDVPEEKNAAEDGSIRFVTDPLGNRILLSGTPEKLARVKEIVELIDVPGPGQANVDRLQQTPQLEVYSVETADPNSVLAVIQTLLEGLPDVRLSVDPKTGSLVAWARPAQQKTIKATLDQLQREARRIEVIQLHTVDPQLAVLSIGKLFGSGNEESAVTAPQVDADPTTRQLFVRGSEAQIAQIRSLLEKMGESDDGGEGLSGMKGNVRMVPLRGAAAQTALQRIQEIWPAMRKNKIRIVAPSAAVPPMGPEGRLQPRMGIPLQNVPLLPGPDEATPAEESPTPQQPVRPGSVPVESPPAVDRSTGLPSRARVFFASQISEVPVESGESQPVEPPKEDAEEPPPIIITRGPEGLIIASEDTKALDEFEELLNSLSGDVMLAGPEMSIFYLKYAKAVSVAQTLNRILTGSTATGEKEGGDAAGGALGGGILGALLGLGGGSGGSITPSGPITITADERLNALFVQAAPADQQTVEQLLQVLDQKESPEEILVVPQTKIIPILNTQADEIVTIVKQVYQDRMVGSTAAQGRQPPSPADFLRMMRGGRGGGSPGNNSPKDAAEKGQKMSLGVDGRSNSIIVAAPEPLLTEVEQLIKQLDTAAVESHEAMRVVTLHKASPEAVQKALSAMMGDSVQFGKSGQPATSRQASGGGSSSAGDAGREARRAFFSDMMRRRMQGGQGQSGRPSRGRR